MFLELILSTIKELRDSADETLLTPWAAAALVCMVFTYFILFLMDKRKKTPLTLTQAAEQNDIAYYSIDGIMKLFNRAIADYHQTDNVEMALENPYGRESLSALFYQKNWIDTVQWHLEDLIRLPQIDPSRALILKRKIDKHNQWRTDLVEQIEDAYMDFLKKRAVPLKPGARRSTETIGWALDRLSILCLKIYHMRIEAERPEADVAHRALCQKKLAVLEQQQKDLKLSLEDFWTDLLSGAAYYQLYRQMKMYNDPNLNPVLYQK